MSKGLGNFDVLVDTCDYDVTMRVFAKTGGKFELLCCKYECVVQRRGAGCFVS